MAEKEEREFAEVSHMGEDNEAAEENQFDLLMFGPGRKEKRQPEEEVPRQGDFNQINLEEVMGHIDTLVDSARQLKPVFSKIRPLLNQFLKK
jgi:hypothetical protein